MKKTIEQLKTMKGNEKVSMLTCYDYSFAKIMDSKVDIILVGDSLGNVVLGYDRTSHVKIEDMIKHVQAVKRGAKNTVIVGDLSHGSYDNHKEAIKNAKKLIEAGADSVKPEGKPEIVKVLVENGIPVMAHLGLLPQTAENLGVVGKEDQEAQEIINLAMQMDEAGAFSLVLECIPNELSKKISEEISIPTIGIGAGKDCDGQVLVLYDMLGLFPDFTPKFVKKYADLKNVVSETIKKYTEEVKNKKFPE